MSTILKESAPALIDCEFISDRVAMVCQKPCDPIVLASFLIGCKRGDNVAVRNETLLTKPNQICYVDRHLVLVIERASPVVVAVTLDKLERVDCPIGRVRFDHVQVSQKEHRPTARITPTIPDDKIALARSLRENLHVLLRKTRGD